jgi:hypothetical protein
MDRKRIACWAWLILGVVTLVYGGWTGGGISGWMFYWELEKFGAVFSETHLLVAVFLIAAPGVLLLAEADRRRLRKIDIATSARVWGRRFLAGGALLAAGAGLCYWRTTLFPDSSERPRRIGVGAISTITPVPESNAILVGTPQRAYAVYFREVLTGRFGDTSSWRHGLIPVTPSSWNTNQPVRFLVDTRGSPFSQVFSSDAASPNVMAASGLLLRGQLPVYVRRALTRKGLRIADDAMVLADDRGFGRTPWFVSVAACSIGAFVLLLLGWFWPWALRHSTSELEALRPRAARYAAYSLGGLLILFCLYVALPKLVHITSAQRTGGVITDVLEHHHSFGRYTYTIKYSTPSGQYEESTVLGALFSRNEGDHVTVLYLPGAPDRPEILAFDEDWVLVLIFFVPGASIVTVGRILFRPRREISLGKSRAGIIL